MRKHLLGFYAVTIFFLSACNESSKPLNEKIGNDSTIIKKWYYENGNLKKIQEYSRDSVENGIYLYYYPNGGLKDSAIITNGKFMGERFQYHDNGHLNIKTIYSNNKYRSAIDYREDGTLEAYRAYNYLKKLMFIIEYDSLGRIVRYEGDPIYTWFIKDTIPLREEFDIELLVAVPPECKTEVVVSDWDKSKNQPSSEKTYTPSKLNSVTYSRKQNPDSDMYILNVATIKTKEDKTLMVDSVYIKIDKQGVTSYTRRPAGDIPFRP